MTTAHPLDDAPLSKFHKKLALYASGGPFLDGYVLSIIGVALVQISPKFGMSSAEEGLVGASALVGIFLGAFLGTLASPRDPDSEHKFIELEVRANTGLGAEKASAH